MSRTTHKISILAAESRDKTAMLLSTSELSESQQEAARRHACIQKIKSGDRSRNK